MATLERAILASAKIELKNPKLRLKDIQEWSTGEIRPQPGEVTLRIADPGVWIAVKTECDHRA